MFHQRSHESQATDVSAASSSSRGTPARIRHLSPSKHATACQFTSKHHCLLMSISSRSWRRRHCIEIWHSVNHIQNQTPNRMSLAHTIKCIDCINKNKDGPRFDNTYILINEERWKWERKVIFITPSFLFSAITPVQTHIRKTRIPSVRMSEHMYLMQEISTSEVGRKGEQQTFPP